MIGSACFVFSLLFIAVCLVEGGCFEGSVFFLVKGGGWSLDVCFSPGA